MFRFVRSRVTVKRTWGDRSAYLTEAAEFSTVEMNLNRGGKASRIT